MVLPAETGFGAEIEPGIHTLWHFFYLAKAWTLWLAHHFCRNYFPLVKSLFFEVARNLFLSATSLCCKRKC